MAPTGPAVPAGTDPETPFTVLRRFAITTLEQNLDNFTVRAAMPMTGMTNPYTDLPSIAALAILVDDVAGRVNYFRFGRPTVSSELTVDLSPGAVETLFSAPDEPVLAAAAPLGGFGERCCSASPTPAATNTSGFGERCCSASPTPAATNTSGFGSPLLSICTLTHRGIVIGTGTVHTVAIADVGLPDRPAGDDPLAGQSGVTLAELMAVQPLSSRDGAVQLRQQPDPMINNMIGFVHGGVSSAGLELAASAALNDGQDIPFQTASIRVNFLRPFVAGDTDGAESRYAGTVLRIGRTTAVGDAHAVGADGKTAVIARITAYR